MPYFLSPEVNLETPGQWFEGNAYEKENLYKIEEGKLPPVNYDKHILKPHSLTHIETPRHIDNSGATIDQFFSGSHFFGKCLVLRLKGNNYRSVGEGLHHWEISLKELQESIEALTQKTTELPSKILITTDEYPEHESGFHDPNYVLTLSQEAADYLVSLPKFHLYGSSWKSTDYAPGSADRPIHKTIFKKGIILENLDLKNVPEGIYFLVSAPIRLVGASESPVCPMLFTLDELSQL